MIESFVQVSKEAAGEVHGILSIDLFVTLHSSIARLEFFQTVVVHLLGGRTSAVWEENRNTMEQNFLSTG